MSDSKKSFILYADMMHTFSQLTDEEAGKLIKHLFLYVNGSEVSLNDRLLKIAFEPIRLQLDRDAEHWNDVKQKRKKAGVKSAERRQQMSTSVNTCQQEPTDSTVTVTDTVTDTVTVNGTVTVTDNVTDNVTSKRTMRPVSLSNFKREKEPIIPTLEQVEYDFLCQGGTKEMAQIFYNKWEGVGWYRNGSPITNYKSYISNFLHNWRQNEKSKRNSKDAWKLDGSPDIEYDPL